MPTAAVTAFFLKFEDWTDTTDYDAINPFAIPVVFRDAFEATVEFRGAVEESVVFRGAVEKTITMQDNIVAFTVVFRKEVVDA